ncbi:VWA domain-containing protein [Zooshikella sp. RANM57]|uniref:VWA domain-containing protein n=1 Tax=Zooshikella sp. RANM57 TaxID=3425863 RepID=UPI003D6F8365
MVVGLVLLGGAKTGYTKEPDVRLLIDTSGSMKVNDPKNLREPAINLLIRLLPDDSKLGIWTFDQAVKNLAVYDLIDNNWRERAINNSKQISSKGLFTDIGKALEVAAFDGHRQSDDARHIILLTDGMVDVAKDPIKNVEARQHILNDQLPRLKHNGYVIHTIALSDKADHELLQQLAINTDGLSSTANSAEELSKLFLKALEQADQAPKVPLQANNFLIDSQVEEFTLLVFKKKTDEVVQLSSPDGKIYKQGSRASDLRWYNTPHYDLITVNQPYEGEWRLQAESDPNNRVTIVSNLQMKFSGVPSNLFKGQQAVARIWFEQNKKRLVNEELFQIMKLTLTIAQEEKPIAEEVFYTAKMSHDQGAFTLTVPAIKSVGEYTLTIAADGKTFLRQVSKALSVREPLLVTHERIVKEEKEIDVIQVKPQSLFLDTEATVIKATIAPPAGKPSNIVIPLQDDKKSWLLPITPQQHGIYRVVFGVDAKDNNGKEIPVKLEPLVFKFPENYKSGEGDEDKKPKPTPEDKATEEVEDDEKEDDSSWLLYGSLIIGNILLAGGLYWAYRWFFTEASPKDKSTEPKEEGVDEVVDIDLEEDDIDLDMPLDKLEDNPDDDGVNKESTKKNGQAQAEGEDENDNASDQKPEA